MSEDRVEEVNHLHTGETRSQRSGHFSSVITVVNDNVSNLTNYVPYTILSGVLCPLWPT